MIRINITEAAFAAIGGLSAADQRESGEGRYGRPPEGMVPIWLAEHSVDALRAQRGPGESYSDVILRLFAKEAA